MIKINKLKVKYQDKVALNIQSELIIEKNDRIGIIGSNGAGKTTFVKAMLGLVRYEGDIVKSLGNQEMAVHLQENNYVETMKIKSIIEAILNTKIKNNQKLQEIIAFFDFEECLNKKFKQISGGQKQRLTIILVLMQDAKMTFFDEVTSGLDFETRKVLMEKIKEWYQDKDSSICIVSHYFEEIEQLVNKILIIEAGKIIDFGTPQALFEKYCGKAIIVLDNNVKNQEIIKGEEQILAPEHLLAIKTLSVEQEKMIVNRLMEQDIQFKRSSNDLEIMYYNAKMKGQIIYENKTI